MKRTKVKRKRMKKSFGDMLFSVITKGILILFALCCIVPFLHLLALSFSSQNPVMRGEVFLIPKEFTFGVYRTIINEGNLVLATFRSIFVTAIYTVVSIIMTILCAYPLAQPGLKGKKAITGIVIFTMYFSGGMIPTYLVVHKLGMIDSYLSLIIPICVSTYNMIVLRTFFTSIPQSLKEAAHIDGAGDFTVLTKVVLPNSKAGIATVSLYYMVSRWNSFMDVLLYINAPEKVLLQLRLRQLIQETGRVEDLLLEEAERVATSQSTKAASLMFSIIPVLIIYPFLQKYFTKGAMLGSVKG